MNKKKILLFTFLILLIITTLSYSVIVGSCLIDINQEDDTKWLGLGILIFSVYTVLIYLVEFDLYFTSRSLIVNWAKKGWISRVMHIIACAISTIIIVFVIVYVIGMCAWQFWGNDILIINGVYTIIGKALQLELIWGIIRGIVLGGIGLTKIIREDIISNRKVN